MSDVPPHKPAPTPGPSSSVNPEPFASPSHHKSPSSSRKILFSPRLIPCLYLTSMESNLVLVPYHSEAIDPRMNDPQSFTLIVTDEEGPVEEEEIGALRKIVKKFARNLIKPSQRAEKEKEKEIESRDVKLLEMEKIEIVDVKLLLMVGKVLYQGASASEEELVQDARNTFYTRVSEEYIREVEQILVEKCGFKFVKAKERYHIKVKDIPQSQLYISCKCKASDGSVLELYKVEHNPQRRMVTDVSCLSRNFDLRIMLNTKRALKNLDADVADSINQLISAAVIDPEAKGGLRWPLGIKESVDGRFVVDGVWHTKHTILSRDKIRVDLRQAGCFDFTTSTGEDINDVSFKLRGLSELLTEEHFPEGSIVDMIQEVVDLIWGNLFVMSRRQ